MKTNNVRKKKRKKTKSVRQGIGPAQTRSMAMVKARLIPYPRTHPVPPAAQKRIGFGKRAAEIHRIRKKHVRVHI